MNKMKRTIVCISYRSYPWGGGEEDLYDKCQLMLQYGLDVIWVSFVNGKAELKPWNYETRDGVIHISIGKPLSKEIVFTILDQLEPDIVYTTDVVMETVTRACYQRHVSVITCWHFWHPGLKLGKEFNKNILKNRHSIDATYHPLRRMSSRSYVCSELVQQVFLKVTRYPKPRVIPSVPQKRVIVDRVEPIYIVMANLHHLKGGEIFLELVKRHKVPLWGLYPERDSEKQMPEQISRASRGKDYIRLDERIGDMKMVYRETKIVLCPSIVDETFGRVAMEAVANKIPLLVSETGNLKYLFPDEEFYLDPLKPKEMADKIVSLTDDDLRHIQKRQEHRYNHICQSYAKTFHTLLDDTMNNNGTTMIFCLWADHGIGIQARTYIRAFEEEGMHTSVFSYTSYVNENKPWHKRKFQADPDEWYHPRCYYSPHIREHVTNEELEAFVDEYNVKTCIIIETCWYRVFEIAEFMRREDITVIAVPNAELVRKDEIEKHKHFDVLACNNQQAFDLFLNYPRLAPKTKFLGFPVFFEPLHKREGPTKLLLIGGLTGARRKNTPLVSEVFSRIQTDMSLTITGQTQESLGDVVEDDTINYIVGNLKHSDIDNLYKEHDIVIIVSEHEGLGLSFFEAMRYNCLIVTVNYAPHNQIVTHEVNGWLLDAKEIETKHNPYPLIKSASVQPASMEDWFHQMNRVKRRDMETFREKAHEYNMKTFGKEKFIERWNML